MKTWDRFKETIRETWELPLLGPAILLLLILAELGTNQTDNFGIVMLLLFAFSFASYLLVALIFSYDREKYKK